jgi:lactoylglutathione lyase
MKYCWTTIYVADMATSLKFYQEIVGLPIHHRVNPNPGMEIVFLGAGETLVELLYDARAGAKDFGNGFSIGFEVPSLDGFIAGLAAKGASLHSGPFQPNPTLRFAYMKDPSGLMVQFVERI